ncbi:MAG TPA: PQQ-binding-like beta-propeller repeat protein, partial [Chitinophagaceae bacterium]|nr:PQQ-binding-like beta-propeller repeat protein [Chitinophagaceae bacterium]
MSSTRQLLFSIYALIFILFLCIPHMGKAQACTPVYKKMYGGIGIDEGLDIVRTTDNGSIVAGRTSSDAANTNSFLMKLNEQGSIQWVKSYGGSQYDELIKVKQASDGGYVAIGNTKSFGQTSGEPFLLRTDANGTILWSRKLNKSGVPARAKSLVTLSDGGFAVGINLNDSTAQGDGLIVRTTAAGTILWSKRFDQGGNDGVHTLLEDGNSLVVSGYATIDFFDAVLMKLNLNDGSVIWAKRFVRHDGLDDQCLNVQKIPGGYAFGVISGFNNGPFNRDGALLTLFKMKEDGTTFFQRGTELGTTSGHTIEFADIRFTADSGFLILINDTLIKKNGTYKKMSASGLTEWGRAPSEWDQLNSISGADLFDSRGYLLTGAYRGNTFGDNTITKTTDVQVLKTDVFGSFGPCTGDKYGAATDTIIFTYSGPFTWKNQRSETVDPDLITLASAPLNFTETLDCETQDCKPVSTDITDKCFASFMAHYSEKYKFVPFDALKVRDGYIMSGYVMHHWSVEPRIVKLNLNGTVAWAKTLNNYIHNASFQKLFLTDDGNILLTGPDDHVIDHNGYTGTTFVKITPGGEVLWAKYVDWSMSDMKPVGNGVF